LTPFLMPMVVKLREEELKKNGELRCCEENLGRQRYL
jgi:hypothetical protein